jgi:PAS domain S-box-containing protein
LLLFAVAITSWYAGTGPAVLALALSISSFYYYFVEPVRTIYIYTSEIPFFITFVAFAALLSWFSTIRRRAEKDLRHRAELLNLTHDTVFVMDVDGVIKYWNRGAEEWYGWTADQAVGSVVHDLLKTVFPAPLDEIKAEVTRAGRWEGELLHTKKDGTQLVVASRWALQRDEQGAPVAILETNNDITERKQAEKALRRLNRELRAISDCNQILLRATDEQSLLEEICRIVSEEAGYRMAWVAYAEHGEAKSVRPAAWTGTEEGYLANLGITWADTERGWGPTGTAIRSGKTCCIQDFATDPRLAPWRESALQRDFRSGIALPLKDEHADVFGSLTIYSAKPNAFTSEEIRLLEELAGDLAFGIVTLRSRAARKQAEQEVALLSFALNNVREAALLIDDTGCFRYVNEEACRVLGYTREELLGMAVPDIDPEFPAGRWPNHWRDLKAQRSLSFESRHRTKDSRILPVEVSGNYFEYGGRAYNLSLVRDITERKRAEEALRRTENELRIVIETIPAYVFSAAPDSTVTFRNSRWREYSGLTLDASSSSWQSAVHPEDLPLHRERWEESFATGKPLDSEARWRRAADGEYRWLWARAVPLRDEQGNILKWYGVLTDVEDRKRAEQALRQSEAYLTEAQRLSHTGSWAWSSITLKTLYWSEEMFRIFALDPQHGVPTSEVFRERLHPEDRDRTYELLLNVAHRASEYAHEHRIVLPDGSVKHIHAIGHPVLDETGRLVEYVGTAMDVTERKRAEETLHESETRFRTFVDHAGDAFFVLDFEQETIVDVNRSACESLGYTREELIGKTPPAFHMDSDRAELEPIAERAAADETVFDTHWHRRKDGSTFPVEVHTSLVSYGGRRFLLKVARDISDRVRVEQERERLRQLEEDLAHINRVSMMGELAASIAHEVNQPLSGVVSNASACLRWLARDAPDMEEVREAVRDIVRDGKRAGEVVARIRALTKRAATMRERLDLNEPIREVLALVGDEAKRNSVVIRTQFVDNLPSVAGDRVQLQQVVLNLVMNAIEAMSSIGERARELVITTRNLDADHVQATVEDSGIGLDPNTIDKIFNSFYTTKPGGMGMGLSISRSILQAHGGRLWATAKDSPGTVFHFTVPKYHEEGAHAGPART